MGCKICAAKGDLFSEVTGEPACSICVLRFNLGSPLQDTAIEQVRERLGLKTGEFLQQDRPSLAAAMLGRMR